MPDWTRKSFDRPDETRTFTKGRLDLVRVGGLTVGRATYEPGWRWSEHAGGGEALCQASHVVVVVAGRNLVTMADGTSFEMGPGDVAYVGPGHDSEVVGAEPYVSLHVEGAEDYAGGGG